MGVPGSANFLLAGSAPGYRIERSLRFNSADSAYLDKTIGPGGTNTKHVTSFWMKRASVNTGSYSVIYGALFNANNYIYIYLSSGDKLSLYWVNSAVNVLNLQSTLVLRDPSAWYHIYYAQDTDQATAANRFRMWVNGVEITSWSTNTNTTTQSVGTPFGGNNTHQIGRDPSSSSAYFNGYITEFHDIWQPSTLPPVTDFGETDTITGVWKPKKYTGTYGTNGFYLNFSDNSANTATTIGKDYSGNGNNWTPNNIGVFTSSASINHGTQRENDYRSATLISGLTGYSTITLNCSYSWSGNLGGSLTQYVKLRDSSNTVVASGSGSGSSGSFTVTGTGLSTGMTYNFFVEAASSGGSYMERAASITVNYSADGGTATTDSFIDTPTPYADGGNGRGNYCTWNPLSLLPNSTITNGNLDASTPVTNGGGIWGTVAFPASGKWYFEVTATSGNSSMIGISSYLATAINAWAINPSVFYWNNGKKYVNGSDGGAYGATYTTNDVIGVAVDCDSGSVTFYKNNSSQGAIGCSPSGLFPCVTDGTSGSADSFSANFGQRAFAYTPPSGFKALNTQNLPEPSIKKPSSYFDVSLYTGNGSAQTVTNSGGFTPDLVWHKGRSVAYSHSLVDSVRGNSNVLFSDITNAEANPGAQLDITTNGFIATYRAANLANNQSSATYVGWQWKESATPGFDIVTYTGNATNRTIAHSLGVAPNMMIVKNRTTGSTGWIVYHSGVASPTTGGLRLNLTDAFVTYSFYWNNTAPTSSVFTVGTDNQVNGNGDSMVAYLWSEVAGFSKFGSYTGNGSSDGPFVFCGFRPRWLMIKASSTGGLYYDWVLYDSERMKYNTCINPLAANMSNGESYFATNYEIDLLPNGFKARNTGGNSTNTNGVTYVFAAFAEAPFKYALAR